MCFRALDVIPQIQFHFYREEGDGATPCVHGARVNCRQFCVKASTTFSSADSMKKYAPELLK